MNIKEVYPKRPEKKKPRFQNSLGNYFDLSDLWKEFTSTANNKPKYCSVKCRDEAARRYRKEYWKTYKKKED